MLQSNEVESSRVRRASLGSRKVFEAERCCTPRSRMVRLIFGESWSLQSDSHKRGTGETGRAMISTRFDRIEWRTIEIRDKNIVIYYISRFEGSANLW